MVKLNVKRFRELVKKATLNNSIGGLQLNFKENRIRTQLRSDVNDVATRLDLPNDVIELTDNDEITMNFSNVIGELLFKLDIFAEGKDEISVNIFDSGTTETYIEFIDEEDGSSGKVNFCKAIALRNFVFNTSLEVDEYFLKNEINKAWLLKLKKIRKGGAQYNKVYMRVHDNIFYFDTGDYTNTGFIGPITVPVMNLPESYRDLCICFDYKNFSNMMEILDDNFEKEEPKKMFINFIYMELDEEKPNGLIHIATEDETENYYLLNRQM